MEERHREKKTMLIQDQEKSVLGEKYQGKKI